MTIIDVILGIGIFWIFFQGFWCFYFFRLLECSGLSGVFQGAGLLRIVFIIFKWKDCLFFFSGYWIVEGFGGGI